LDNSEYIRHIASEYLVVRSELEVDVESAPAYEFVLALGVMADEKSHAAYRLGSRWFAALRRVCPGSLLRAVSELSGGSDMIWAHLLTLAYELSPPRTPRVLVQQIEDIDRVELRRRLFGYYVRYFRRATPPDVMAAAAAGDRRAARRFLETSYPHDQAWQRALRRLSRQAPKETRDAFRLVLEQWEQVAPKLLDLTPEPVTAEAQRLRRLLRRQPPDQVIAQVLGQDMFVPEPGVRRVVLIPSLVIAPIVHRFDHHELQFICHPVPSSPILGDPDAPPPILLRLTRALADERRLRIVRVVATDQLTAVELAERLDTGLTTLAHHLDILRGAGVLLANRSGRKRYRSNPDALNLLHELLSGYLTPATSPESARPH